MSNEQKNSGFFNTMKGLLFEDEQPKVKPVKPQQATVHQETVQPTGGAVPLPVGDLPAILSARDISARFEEALSQHTSAHQALRAAMAPLRQFIRTEPELWQAAFAVISKQFTAEQIRESVVADSGTLLNEVISQITTTDLQKWVDCKRNLQATVEAHDVKLKDIEERGETMTREYKAAMDALEQQKSATQKTAVEAAQQLVEVTMNLNTFTSNLAEAEKLGGAVLQDEANLVSKYLMKKV